MLYKALSGIMICLNFFLQPTDSRLVKNVVEVGKRKLAKPIHKKEPMTVKLLHNMFSQYVC
jgi:hypothetical protein